MLKILGKNQKSNMGETIKTLAKKCLEDKWGEGQVLEDQHADIIERPVDIEDDPGKDAHQDTSGDVRHDSPLQFEAKHIIQGNADNRHEQAQSQRGLRVRADKEEQTDH